MNPYRTAQRQFLREIEKHGVDVTLRWRSVLNGVVHPTTGAILGDPMEVSETVKGFFQPMDPKTQIRLFNQVQEGIAIVDLPADTVIEGRDGLVFEIDGRQWVQEKAGEEVVEHYGTYHDGVRYCRTLILRRQT